MSDDLDAKARAELLYGYFSSGSADPAIAAQRADHVIWFIANQPADPFLGTPFCLIPPGDASHERVAAAWRQALTRATEQPMIILNAAQFFAPTDPGRAQALLELGEQLVPASHVWARALATLAMAAGYPAEALAQSERALALVTDPTLRVAIDGECAVAAFACDKLDVALAHLDAVIAASPGPAQLYIAHTTRGRVLLRRGDVAGATRELGAAVDLAGKRTSHLVLERELQEFGD